VEAEACFGVQVRAGYSDAQGLGQVLGPQKCEGVSSSGVARSRVAAGAFALKAAAVLDGAWRQALKGRVARAQELLEEALEEAAEWVAGGVEVEALAPERARLEETLALLSSSGSADWGVRRKEDRSYADGVTRVTRASWR
jgi:hypothetical protein